MPPHRWRAVVARRAAHHRRYSGRNRAGQAERMAAGWYGGGGAGIVGTDGDGKPDGREERGMNQAVKECLITEDGKRSVIYQPKVQFNCVGIKWYPEKKISASPDGRPEEAK